MKKNGFFAIAIGGAVLALAHGSALAGGDAAEGEKVFKRYCRACHTVEPGKHRVGPSLANVFGEKAGTTEGFGRYSDALKNADVTWDDESLDKWLADPNAFIPGNKMTFRGVRKEDDREDLIAYLKKVSK